MKPREIDVHIEELVLHGLPNGSRYQIADALQKELGTLLVERGIPAEWQSSPEKIETRVQSTGPQPRTAAMGDDIARAIYGRKT